MGPKRLCYAAKLLALTSGVWAKAPTAAIKLGTYSGVHLPSFNQDLFLGIPYADAPVLDNPRPLNGSWDDIRAADAYGPACHQNAPEGYLERIGIGMSADCLSLNIIRPAGHEDEALPVVVWIHGGGFAASTGADPGTNTSFVVQASVENGMPVMAVTLNYRLGFLGFPGGYQAAAAGITNLGLKDQRIALRWIQDNIAAFGGDPKRVTAWGQSAGAMSVGHQMLAYGGDGADELLHRGILVSGAPFEANALFPTHPMCVEGYASALNATGCIDAENTLECLRAAPVDIMSRDTVGNPFAFWPSIDGDFIREPPAWQLEKGLFSRDIPIITGANNDEGLISAQYFGATLETDDEMASFLRAQFPAARESIIQEVLNTYPVDAPSPPYSLPMDDTFCEAMMEVNFTCGAQYRRVAAVMGDQAQISGSRIMARTWAEQGLTAYRYRFDTNPTSIPIVLNDIAPGFATHSAEYSYFFGFPPDFDRYGTGPTVIDADSHIRLSRGIVDMFISFIATGDPNALGVEDFPVWPAYSVDEPVNMVLNATVDALNVHVEPDTWRQEGMALWDTYGIELQSESNWRP